MRKKRWILLTKSLTGKPSSNPNLWITRPCCVMRGRKNTVNIVNGNRRPHPVDGENCCWSFSALTLIWSLTLLMSCVAPVSAAGKQPVDYVQPFSIHPGIIQLFPGPVAPFGMIQLSPDSYPSGFDHKAHSGYNYEDTRLMGFSHVRLGGTGCSGSGGIFCFSHLPVSRN